MSTTTDNRPKVKLAGYATEAVPADVSVSGLRIGLVNGGLAFAVPGLITGLELGGALGFRSSLSAFLIGGLLLALLGSITGYVGYRNRLSSSMTIKCVFGRKAAALINLIIALSLLGWYGINMDLFSDVIAELMQRWLGTKSKILATELIAGIAITLIALFGFSLMERLSTLLVPIMIALMAYLAIQLDASAFEALPISGAPDLTLMEAISVVLGSFIVGVVLMPDFTRFAGSTAGTAVASFVPFLILSSLVYVVSAGAGLMVQSSDALEVLLALGVGGLAFLLIVISSFLTNVVNLYSAGLSINAVFTQLKEWHIVLIAGLLGTLLASLNLLERFTDFLFGLAVIFAPIAGVYVVDFLVTRRSRIYSTLEYRQTSNRQILAVLCWIAGVLVSLLSQANVWSLLGLQSLDGLITAIVLYALLSHFVAEKPSAQI